MLSSSFLKTIKRRNRSHQQQPPFQTFFKVMEKIANNKVVSVLSLITMFVIIVTISYAMIVMRKENVSPIVGYLFSVFLFTPFGCLSFLTFSGWKKKV